MVFKYCVSSLFQSRFASSPSPQDRPLSQDTENPNQFKPDRQANPYSKLMNFAPYQWRANEGYLPPSDSFAMPVAHFGYPVIAYSQPPPPGASYTYAHQIVYRAGCFPGCLPGTVGVQAVVAARPGPGPAPTEAGSKKSSSSSRSWLNKGSESAKSKRHSLPPPPPAPLVVKKSDTQASEPPSCSGPANTYRAVTLRPGVNYMYPSRSSHTMLHIFNKTTPLWSLPPPPTNSSSNSHAFKIFRVSVAFTVKNVIERVRNDSSGEKCKGWAATEVIEAGGGTWRKGTTVVYEGEKSDGTLKSMGWDERRGEGRPPVWIVVHKS